MGSGRYNVSTLYNYRTSREYNTLRNGDHCSPDIRACKTWNEKKGNQHRNSGEKEKEKCIRRQIKVQTSLLIIRLLKHIIPEERKMTRAVFPVSSILRIAPFLGNFNPA